ncbi:MAG: HNH endonuclease [bacterium]
MAEFEKLQSAAESRGERGASLGHVLAKYGGAKYSIPLVSHPSRVEFSFSQIGSTEILSVPLYQDSLSGMKYFFTTVPLAYLHHDDRINPRTIGSNIRGLIEEFMKKRPQLHVALAWWAPENDGAGRLRVFDGQHKAAAQILLGVKEIPVRVFVEPNTSVLLQANTNAGDKLRQVAFDSAVLRHLGSTLYAERVKQYQDMKSLRQDDYSFSEKDLVGFFKGEHREMQRYIVDSVRDSINFHKDNRLREFVEWAGKGSDRPMSYSSIERTFFAEFLYMKVIENPIGQGIERGDNPRFVERDQMVRLMNLVADIFFVGQWDPDIGGRKLENRVQKKEQIPEPHLRAWRIAREEILANILGYVRLVIENYYALVGERIDKDRLMQHQLPEALWQRVETFLRRLRDLPCWVDANLSLTVFGAKQNRDFWVQVFKTAKGPGGVPVLAKPLDLMEMIQDTVVAKRPAS